MTTGPVKRVRITHPRTEAARRAPARTPSREIDEQTELGEIYMRSLIRSQRRLALAVCGAIGVVLAGIALAGAAFPRFGTSRLLGLPLPWVLLGVLVYPVLIALAAYAVRQSERNERAFTDLVRRR
ncbi:MAG TPA: hypothetical protein VFE40_04585 [Jatrophihabitantaceae bacterium]|jgi:hypothetical protein|nr:hypothetical protein [Jatrophihabitantaceae bacterium]